MDTPSVVVCHDFTVLHSFLRLNTHNPIVLIYTPCVVYQYIDINVFYSKLPYITKALVKLNTTDKEASLSLKGLNMIKLQKRHTMVQHLINQHNVLCKTDR